MPERVVPFIAKFFLILGAVLVWVWEGSLALLGSHAWVWLLLIFAAALMGAAFGVLLYREHY